MKLKKWKVKLTKRKQTIPLLYTRLPSKKCKSHNRLEIIDSGKNQKWISFICKIVGKDILIVSMYFPPNYLVPSKKKMQILQWRDDDAWASLMEG